MRYLRPRLRLAQEVGAGLGFREALFGPLPAAWKSQTGGRMTRIAIIGAGLAGLTLARKLSAAASVTVFDKSRGFGGRMATRQAAPFAFDHGAQYFTARDPAFRTLLEPYLQAGIVRPWEGKAVTLNAAGELEGPTRDLGFVAAPRMTSLAKAMAEGLDVRLEAEVSRLEHSEGGWWLAMKTGVPAGPFDWVISTAPAPQTQKLMPAGFQDTSRLQNVKMTGCLTAMLGFETPLALPFDAAFVTGSPIGWIAVDSSKPGRDGAFSLLAQSTNEWAESHLEGDPADVQDQLLTALAALLGADVRRHSFASLHRWRYAATPAPLGQPFLLDAARGLAACGDWCLSGRVESAFLSANALADQLLPLLGHRP